MAEKKQNTRLKIMEVAEELLASKGVDAVSLNEINKAAGQKNTSSLHYHFGNKEGLIDAIVYWHYQEIEEKFQASIRFLKSKGNYELDELIDHAIAPFVDKLETPRGVNYLLIVNQLLNQSADMMIVGHPDKVDKGREEMLLLFEALSEDMPVDVKVARLVLFSCLLFQSLASFARFEESGKPNPLGDKAFYLSNLKQMLKAMMSAPY